MMLEKLSEIDNLLLNNSPEAFIAIEDWNGIDITYEQPQVKRLWKQDGDYRIYLHKIFPCDKPFYHPHPWASAMLILQGYYEMDMGGYPVTTEPPEPMIKMILPPGTRYAMEHPHGWHSVKPLGAPVYTLMVTGKPWPHAKSFKKPSVLPTALPQGEKVALLQEFSDIFDYRKIRL